MLQYQGPRTSQNASAVSVFGLLEVRRGAVLLTAASEDVDDNQERMLAGMLVGRLGFDWNASATPRLSQIEWERRRLSPIPGDGLL